LALVLAVVVEANMSVSAGCSCSFLSSGSPPIPKKKLLLPARDWRRVTDVPLAAPEEATTKIGSGPTSSIHSSNNTTPTLAKARPRQTLLRGFVMTTGSSFTSIMTVEKE
jgi:hypothetical protein